MRPAEIAPTCTAASPPEHSRAPTHGSRHRRTALRLAASLTGLCLAGTALSGCNSASVTDEFHPRLTDPARRHPILMLAETATLDLSSHSTDKGSEARAYVETTRFVRNYRYEGRGPLQIAVPRNSGGHVARRVQNVRLVAYRNGVPSERIRVVSKPGGHGTVTLSYDRIAAVGPTCGDWSEDVTRNKQNLPYANFGCATQRNLAAMAANPMDLMYPAAETPRAGDTRAADQKNFQQKIGKDAPTLTQSGVR